MVILKDNGQPQPLFYSINIRYDEIERSCFKESSMKLHPIALGLAGGIVLGIYTLGFTLISVWTGYGAEFLKVWVPLHPGYEISYAGSLIGFCYSFVEGFLWLWLTAKVYNLFAGKCCEK